MRRTVGSHADPTGAAAELKSEGIALWTAVGRHLTGNVPRYPEWTGAELVRHVGTVHRWALHILTTLPATRPDRPALGPHRDGAMGEWFAEGLDALASAIVSADPNVPVWTISPEGRAGFWFGRMLHETMLHRWDAESIDGTPIPFRTDLAVSAIAESIQIHVVQRAAELTATNDTYVVTLAPLDADQSWVLRCVNGGVSATAAEPSLESDATIRGNASDLWLFMTGRPTRNVLHIEGSIPAVDNFGALLERIPSAAETHRQSGA